MARDASLLKDAIARFVERNPGWKPFVTPPEKGARPGGKSTGRPAASQQQQGGGVSLVEADYTAREYWAARTVTSPDGIFTIEVLPIKSILLDDNTRATFKEPV